MSPIIATPCWFCTRHLTRRQGMDCYVTWALRPNWASTPANWISNALHLAVTTPSYVGANGTLATYGIRLKVKFLSPPTRPYGRETNPKMLNPMCQNKGGCWVACMPWFCFGAITHQEISGWKPAYPTFWMLTQSEQGCLNWIVMMSFHCMGCQGTPRPTWSNVRARILVWSLDFWNAINGKLHVIYWEALERLCANLSLHPLVILKDPMMMTTWTELDEQKMMGVYTTWIVLSWNCDLNLFHVHIHEISQKS